MALFHLVWVNQSINCLLRDKRWPGAAEAESVFLPGLMGMDRQADGAAACRSGKSTDRAELCLIGHPMIIEKREPHLEKEENLFSYAYKRMDFSMTFRYFE